MAESGGGAESLPGDKVLKDHPSKSSGPMPPPPPPLQEGCEEVGNERMRAVLAILEGCEDFEWVKSLLAIADKRSHMSRASDPPVILRVDRDPYGLKANKDLWHRYSQDIRESDGYDINYFPGVCPLTSIVPLLNFKGRKATYEKITRLAEEALKEWNKNNNCEGGGSDDQFFVLHDILKVNVTASLYSSYYITFQAKQQQQGEVEEETTDDQRTPVITTFQARVTLMAVTGEVDVEECRIKRAKTPPPLPQLKPLRRWRRRPRGREPAVTTCIIGGGQGGGQG